MDVNNYKINDTAALKNDKNNSYFKRFLCKSKLLQTTECVEQCQWIAIIATFLKNGNLYMPSTS